ncbi:hypothetical protein QJS04_geneDACA002575 [Acorus gramineus]|uniref:No apical meristem-associated C-terminal domain-containing protein n=1 Tax=Acorus gramineus TaxID=55184 RepID=A0AAV9ARQ8_ACOGR|nr:hypothetical protein QJS04_geneDACA002575 [Acorus gramineus]
MENESVMRHQLMMLQAENERTKLQLRQERQEKKFMEVDLNSIVDQADREYFRRKKKEIIERKARASQTPDNSSTLNHDDFSSFDPFAGGLGDY